MGSSQEKRKKTRKNRRTAYHRIGNGETPSAVTAAWQAGQTTMPRKGCFRPTRATV